jgi:leucyl/phenylalanyl-tRNA--protein transferase
MTPKDPSHLAITPDMVLRAYACGIFPMAESADDPSLYWVEPEQRGIIPLDGLHISTRLERTVRSDVFAVTADVDFAAVIDGCASVRKDGANTWINGRIRELYGALHRHGHCHSIEVWDGEVLAGGLYGVSLGSAFFGESMFHVRRDASKVALVHLVARLIAGGYTLLDTQFVTPHLATLGAIEVSRARYRTLLDAALGRSGNFAALPLHKSIRGAEALRIVRHAPVPVPPNGSPKRKVPASGV